MEEDDFLTEDELDALNEEDDDSSEIEESDASEIEESNAPEIEQEEVETPIQEPVANQPVSSDTEQLSYEDKMSDLASKIDELGTQLEDGEISLKEYNKSLSELTEERAVLRLEYSQQVRNAEKMQNDWETAQKEFFSMSENKAFSEKPILHGALNTAVIHLSNRQDLIAGKSYSEILQMAKAQVETDLGITIGDKPKQTQKRALDTTELPKTLSGIPASESQDSGKFTHLDRLSPEELEEALSKMSKQDQDEYLRS